MKHKPYAHNKVRCVEGAFAGLVFPNVTAAATAIGCGKSAMCNHLNGRFPAVRGMKFERVVE